MGCWYGVFVQVPEQVQMEKILDKIKSVIHNHEKEENKI